MKQLMSVRLLEHARALLQSLEVDERLLAKDFGNASVRGRHEKLYQSHRVASILSSSSSSASWLLEHISEPGSNDDASAGASDTASPLYLEVHSLLKCNPVLNTSTYSASSFDFRNFDARLKELHAYHDTQRTDVTHALTPGRNLEEEELALIRVPAHVVFTGEEDRGRYLDLIDKHADFLSNASISGAAVKARAAADAQLQLSKKKRKKKRKRKTTDEEEVDGTVTAMDVEDDGVADEPEEAEDEPAATPLAQQRSPNEVLDYQSFLSAFPNVLLEEVPRRVRMTAAYRTYVEGVVAYLFDFIARTQPLFDAKAAVASAIENAQYDRRAIPEEDELANLNVATKELACGPVRLTRIAGRGIVASVVDYPGWDGDEGECGVENETGAAATSDAAREETSEDVPSNLPIPALDAYASPDAVVAALDSGALFGGDGGAKRVLAAVGVKSGGTMQERAHRLHALKGRTNLDGLPKSMLAKKKSGGGGGGGQAGGGGDGEAELRKSLLAALRSVRQTIAVEARLRAVSNLPVVQAVLSDTLARVQFKLSRTAEEAAEDDARILAEERLAAKRLAICQPAKQRGSDGDGADEGAITAFDDGEGNAPELSRFAGLDLPPQEEMLLQAEERSDAIDMSRPPLERLEHLLKKAEQKGARGGDATGGLGLATEEEEEAPIYNPLKLPMGWDGKPIPYWLYKLHGLDQEFVCEICGNYSYWGRRAFEKHFYEPRHQHGLRCLGIPNTKAFLEITRIEDARSLQAELAQRSKHEKRAVEGNKGASAAAMDDDEEVEDAMGNVYTKKVYNDLLRQGLL